MELNRSQRKNTANATKRLNGIANISFAARGRRSFKMTPVAGLIVVVAVALLSKGIIVGVIPIAAFIDLVRPRRFVGLITDASGPRVVTFKGNFLNGAPSDIVCANALGEVSFAEKSVRIPGEQIDLVKKDRATFAAHFAAAHFAAAQVQASTASRPASLLV